ncbi:MAG: epoxyqueuosine reductase QueH [Candidatus Cloacimonetes bacterium]|nr:epoxyqueuosine reductase QueH [Candidatus Cloacimonadota bacterium]
MKLLMHICCAPCFIAPWEHLKNRDDLEITGFWYNPNIQPYQEFRRRLETLRVFCTQEKIPLIENDSYDLERFIHNAVNSEHGRCVACYHDRLETTVRTASEHGYTHFSSTLLYSKFQNHERIIQIAKELAEQYHIDFYYEDFRIYWKEGIELSKSAEMYRQQYCGCIYSERDRYEDFYRRLDKKSKL